MSLSEQIDADFKAAYKAKDQTKVDVLRMLKTALKNRQVELLRPLEHLPDDQVLDVILKQAKQRQESIDVFASAGRTDLLDKEVTELGVLESYLPSQLAPEELQAVISETIASLGAKDVKDMGRVMQAITTAYKGRVDMKDVSARVRAALSGQ